MYIYNDHLILILNVVDNKNNVIKVPLIEDLESSFLGTRGVHQKREVYKRKIIVYILFY